MKLTFNGKVMEEIVNELKKRKIEFRLSFEGNGQLEVEGFSKSSTCRIVEDEDGVVTAHTRYNRTDILDSFGDLVGLNYRWFDDYRDREPFTKPSSYWVDTLIEFGYIKKKVETVIKYE